jgi:predicted membrane-bound spermidine synthase
MEQAGERRWLIVVYAATIFLSALLLFQVQPIISRYVQPWFGGTPAVWTTAMLFFQTLLFAGYAYAHLSVQYFKPQWQVGVQLVLLAAAIVSLPFVPHSSWKPVDGTSPALRILLLLTVSVGLPYFVLATTGPLVQTWFSRTIPGRSPYRLYSLSNLGSLLALLSYPFLIEPHLPLGSQAMAWQWGFWLFAALCAFGAISTIRGTTTTLAVSARSPASPAANAKSERRPRRGAPQAGAPTWGRRVLWLALPALASTAFLATTSFSCQDTPAVPFLCIAPLSLYLLSFVICFDHERWYRPRTTATAMLLILAAAFVYSHEVRRNSSLDRIQLDLGLSFAGLFCLCMLCHGELVLLKPDPKYLTSFYLMLAAGGALGGLFVGIIAPLVFPGYYEWYFALWGGLILAAAILIGTGERGLFRRHVAGFLPATAILAMVIIVAASLGSITDVAKLKSLEVRRNFYGVLTVKQYSFKGDEVARMLYNGHILHGLQFTQSLERRLPTAYYGWQSGIGRVMQFYQSAANSSVRVGAIGLGTGTIAAYARPHDHFVFYEINPEVQNIARHSFTFLDDAEERMAKGRGSLDVVMGDARLSLERDLKAAEAPKLFDVIILDAFTGDAIPTHFLTREAADIYRRHLADGGALALHITNRYLDLTPVARGLADYLGLNFVEIESRRDQKQGIEFSEWALLTANEKLRAALERTSAQAPLDPPSSAEEYLLSGSPLPDKDKLPRPPLLWTDDFSDLFRILR